MAQLVNRYRVYMYSYPYQNITVPDGEQCTILALDLGRHCFQARQTPERSSDL